MGMVYKPFIESRSLFVDECSAFCVLRSALKKSVFIPKICVTCAEWYTEPAEVLVEASVFCVRFSLLVVS